jgi:hypothetical protein
MSDQRYILVQEISTNRIDLDCPVEIEKGALLRDNETSKVLLQLKLNIINADYRQLFAVKLQIDCFDEVGDPVIGFHPYFQDFKDINLFGTQSFEDCTPILLDFRTRRIEISIERVTFIDGSEWQSSGKNILLPEQKRINSLGMDLQDQVNRDICMLLPDENRERIVFIPQQADNFWLCTCGRPNRNKNARCCRCGISRRWIFRNLSETGINRNLEKYENTLKQLNEENRLVKEYAKERREKWKHQWQRAIVLVLSTSLFLALFIFVGNPYIRYAHAQNLLQDAKFDEAITAFTALGDFKNSEEMIKETNYEKAFNQLANQRFDEALILFMGNNNYRNSAEMISEVKFQKSNFLLANKLYDESISIFTDLGDYKNSEMMVHEANYQKAMDLLQQNKFEAAAVALTFNRGYKDSDKLFNKAYFLWGIQLMGRNQWDDAKNILSKVDIQIYPEVTALIEDAQERIEKQN